MHLEKMQNKNFKCETIFILHNTEYEKKIKFVFISYGLEFYFLPKFLPLLSL